MKPNRISGLKIGDLRAFDAVAQTLSFAEAGRLLGRSHPSVFAAVGRLEDQLGLQLLDRQGYRSRLTEAGATFHARLTHALRGLGDLVDLADELRSGREPTLTVVLGDISRREEVLKLLARFFAAHPDTQLNLDYEAVGGPAERLRSASADLAIHRVDEGDLDLEVQPLERIRLIPVAAPLFFGLPADRLSIDLLRSRPQCVIRDTAFKVDRDYFLVDGAPRCTVPDHGMKKELIVEGLAWGHLPNFLIVEELRDGSLVDLSSDRLPGRSETIGVMRRREARHGPVAESLWRTFKATGGMTDH
jgi:DNA-binding transcriptional LysR family regulator